MISEKQLMKRELERIGKMKMRNTKGMIRGWLTVVCVMMMMWVYSMNVLATAETGSTIYVNSDGTNVREGADTESASIGKANAGDAFSVVGQETDGSGAVWYNVSGTINGESKTGYIRSDLVSTSAPAEAPAEEMMLTEENAEAVTEPEAAEEVPEAQAPVENGESATVTTATSVGTLTPVEPEGTPEALPSGFRSVSINVNDVQVPAWTNDEFYIFYAAAPSGNIDWYVYDSVDGGYVRYTGFLLRSTISDSSVSENGKGAVSLPIVIVMSIVIVILVVVTLVMGIKLMNAGGDEEDDEDDYEDDEEEEDDYEEKPKKKSIFHKVSQAFADDEDDDEYDDEERTYAVLNDHTWVFEAKTQLTDFYKITQTDESDFEKIAGDADTLAGMLLEIKGEFPALHEKVSYKKYDFEVLAMDNRRILKVKFSINESERETKA